MSRTANALTINEAAQLASVSPRRIEKCVEEGIVPKTRNQLALNRGVAMHVPVQTVPYAAAVSRVKGMKMSEVFKKRIWKSIRKSSDTTLGVVELGDGLRWTLDEVAGVEWAKALRYLHARETYLVSDPDILGGDPIIRGTRITCRSVLGRIDGGEALEDLQDDYPEVPLEAFEAAEIYARAHPSRGRPSAGKPWRAQ